MDLIKRLNLTSDSYGVFGHHIGELKNLPIALRPWPVAQITELQQHSTNQQQTSIIKWAEKFNLFYSLGYHGNQEIYFIPLLATEFLGDHATYDWPEGDETDHWYNLKTTTTLYAKLNFSATDHFFYSVLTEMLKDIVNAVRHNPKKCFIKYLCREAIMPVHVAEANTDITVYLKYHLLQNVIEFRTR